VLGGRFTDSRAFLLLGLGLIALAFIAFPTRVEFGDQWAIGGSEHYNVGWLFAPIIGVWGLASIALGLIQSSMPKQRVEYYLLLILVVVCTGLAFAGFMAIVYGSGIVMSVGRGEPLFLIYFGLVLVPSLIIVSSIVRFMKMGERANFLVNKKVKAVVFFLLAAVPLTYSLVFLAYTNLL
jgi:hypothetical protein